MKEVKINIPEDVVEEIQLKDAKVRAHQGILTSFLESHTLDSSADILERPIIVKYQEMTAEAQAEFEKAKDTMIMSFVDPEVQKTVASWNLDYGHCELILKVR